RSTSNQCPLYPRKRTLLSSRDETLWTPKVANQRQVPLPDKGMGAGGAPLRFQRMAYLLVDIMHVASSSWLRSHEHDGFGYHGLSGGWARTFTQLFREVTRRPNSAANSGTSRPQAFASLRRDSHRHTRTGSL